MHYIHDMMVRFNHAHGESTNHSDFSGKHHENVRIAHDIVC